MGCTTNQTGISSVAILSYICILLLSCNLCHPNPMDLSTPLKISNNNNDNASSPKKIWVGLPSLKICKE
uniref:Uncharacterized protein n=1 Tax=Arundo donax TaxID=35708 RepID=A0A0A9AV11_ARUDO